MFIAVKGGRVMQKSDNIDSLLPLEDQGYEVFEWNGPEPVWRPQDDEPRPLDPRDTSQRDKDIKDRYKRQRRKALPSSNEMFAMIYRDMKNGTTEYVDVVDAVHAQFPKPAQGGPH
jgi:hypothetical protein